MTMSLPNAQKIELQATAMSTLQIDILSLFPGIFESPFAHSIVKRGMANGRLFINLHDLRLWGIGRHRQLDDVPYGGGPGMVLKPEPIFNAVRDIREKSGVKAPLIYLSPQGRKLTPALAAELAAQPQLIFLAGRYEGVDQRVIEHLVDVEVSAGDFVVAGGEIPALLLLEAVIRFVPGVVGDAESVRQDSFEGAGGLDTPHYTRPAAFEGLEVPPVLLSGSHAKISAWRNAAAQAATRQKRPDLPAAAQPEAATGELSLVEGGKTPSGKHRPG
jgi:tRNA (guanine37-N1)-methyltransferase